MSAVPARPELTDEQRHAVEAVAAWLKAWHDRPRGSVAGSYGWAPGGKERPSQYLTFGGFAGTGKSFVLSQLGARLGVEMVYCAPTGKAADVLRRKLADAGVSGEVSTVHSLIYRPLLDERGHVIGWERRTDVDAELIVCDEASQVDSEVLRDLLSFGLPVLFVGDHGQLPPVGAGPNLMQNPTVRLETVHRQALGSPILQLATAVREGRPLSELRLDPNVVWFGQGRTALLQVVEAMLPGDWLRQAVIVHRNATRCELNRMVRQGLKRSGLLEEGEIVMCLKNAKIDSSLRIYNGQRGTIRGTYRIERAEAYGADGRTAGVTMADFQVGVDLQIGDLALRQPACVTQFGRSTVYSKLEEFESDTHGQLHLNHFSQLGLLLDYGYAATCHKMQGDQAEDVLIALEPSVLRCSDPPDFARRWMYTAVSRATRRVAVVSL